MRAILTDPERIRRKPEGRFYPLGSRIRCGLCGAAMAGQTLTNRGKPHRYYRCRHAYDKNTGHECSARYVSADRIEDAVRLELVRVLANPDLILREMKELASRGTRMPRRSSVLSVNSRQPSSARKAAEALHA